MKKTTFTDTMIKKLKPAESDYCRSEGNGFAIRVMPSGTKSWLYQYSFDGKRRKLHLGCYPEVTLETARDKFASARQKVKNGIDPIAEIERVKQENLQVYTVAKLVEEYMSKWAEKKKTVRSAYNDRRALEKDILPVWGKRLAQSIRRRDAISLLEDVAARAVLGPVNLPEYRRIETTSANKPPIAFSFATGGLNLRIMPLSDLSSGSLALQ